MTDLDLDAIARRWGSATPTGRLVAEVRRLRALQADTEHQLVIRDKALDRVSQNVYLRSCADCRWREKRDTHAICAKGATSVRLAAPPPDDCPLRGAP